jgi:hypothetical protein
MAKDLVHKLRSEVQSSARQTIEALAKGFGADRVTVDFSESDLQMRGDGVKGAEALVKSQPVEG